MSRPESVTVAAVLTGLAALALLAYPLWFIGTYLGRGTIPMLAIAVQGLVPAAAYAVCVPGLLRGRQWARVAVTALGSVAVLSTLPNVLAALASGPDPVLLAYSAGQTVLLGALALLWSRSARDWFGPVH
ncbi:hypothetical protein GCM10009623_06380 [Nocardioides aestuarii]